MSELNEQTTESVEDMVISLPKKEDETMNSCPEPTSSNQIQAIPAEDTENNNPNSISVDEYNQEYQKLNIYIDEVFNDLERNYKNAFNAIENQFNEVFDKMKQFEENLKEVLSTSSNSTGTGSTN